MFISDFSDLLKNINNAAGYKNNSKIIEKIMNNGCFGEMCVVVMSRVRFA